MAIRKLSALWLVYCYHDLRSECFSKPSLVCGDQQYGVIPQSATTFGRSCKVYTSSSTSKVREDWAVLLPWYQIIRSSNERLIVNHRYFELADYRVDNRMTLSRMIWGAGGYPIWSNRKANTDRPGSDSRCSWYAGLPSPMSSEAFTGAIECARMVFECKLVSLVLERIWHRDYDGEYDSLDTKSLASTQTIIVKTAKDFERRARIVHRQFW
jgi:hypothetical protein